MAEAALDSSVLVLNRHYAAVHVVSARRAFCLVFKRIAEVISLQNEQYLSFDFDSWKELSALKDEFPGDEEEVVRGVSFNLRVPLIIRLIFYDKLPRHAVRFNRRNIFARDANRCQYCGRRFPTSELSLDHVHPRSLGGPSSWENLVCACTSCNAKKGGRTPEAAGMRLMRRPVKPRRNPVLRFSLGTARHRSWKQFLSDAYWDVELK